MWRLPAKVLLATTMPFLLLLISSVAPPVNIREVQEGFFLPKHVNRGLVSKVYVHPGRNQLVLYLPCQSGDCAWLELPLAESHNALKGRSDEEQLELLLFAASSDQLVLIVSIEEGSGYPRRLTVELERGK